MAKATFFQEPIPEEERIFYYESLEDDPIKTKEQEHKEKVLLPEDYEFIPKNPFKRLYWATWFWMFVALGLWYELYYWGLKLKGPQAGFYVVLQSHQSVSRRVWTRFDGGKKDFYGGVAGESEVAGNWEDCAGDWRAAAWDIARDQKTLP